MKKISSIALLLLIFRCAISQDFKASFEYDENGNRVFAKVIYLSLSPELDNQGDSQNDNINNISFKVFPNPTQGVIRIELIDFNPEDFTQEFSRLQVFDVSGKQIIQKSYFQQIVDVNLSSFPDGIYLLKLSFGGISNHYKIIKQ